MLICSLAVCSCLKTRGPLPSQWLLIVSVALFFSRPKKKKISLSSTSLSKAVIHSFSSIGFELENQKGLFWLSGRCHSKQEVVYNGCLESNWSPFKGIKKMQIKPATVLGSLSHHNTQFMTQATWGRKSWCRSQLIAAGRCGARNRGLIVNYTMLAGSRERWFLVLSSLYLFILFSLGS